MIEHTINDNFCYEPNKELSLPIVHKALKRYSEYKQEAFNISGKIPIVVDTSVLLRYYKMSQQDKKELLAFLEKQKDRIILTRQIEKEFLGRRISVIQKDFFNPLNKIHKSFEETYKGIKSLLSRFIDDNQKLFSRDYPDIWESLSEKRELLEQNILADEKELGEKIKSQIEETLKNNKDININDELLDICSQFTVLSSLNEEEIQFIEKLYDKLNAVYQNVKDNEKSQFVFPGCGDQRDKGYPYGDFIIFHEILKFMKKGLNKEQPTDVIFLTNEREKGDWFNKDMTPIVHYINQVYLNTERSLFIINAERWLENISFDNIHQSDISNQDLIRESIVLRLNKEEKWGFIETRIDNLYFNLQLMKNPDEFMDLNEGDIVRYQIRKNQWGEDVAGNVEKIIYSFDDDKLSKEESTICNIKIFGDIYGNTFGYGFIHANPENLYFKSTDVTGSFSFDKLKKFDKVEYIKGKNENGDEIARKVRKLDAQD
ncbi:MAG TPA: PIN-like domain-containing protein [Nostocaceae cyanobacterium]|nr:PIN-like domain-containing protein [Nostocaceae cyanobacterium]